MYQCTLRRDGSVENMPYLTDALASKTILIVEDEYMLADAIEASILSAGGAVRGPFATVQDALEDLAARQLLPDAAALNIRLQGEVSFPVADELRRIGVPFVFASGTSRETLPERFASSSIVDKPYTAFAIVQALVLLVQN